MSSEGMDVLVHEEDGTLWAEVLSLPGCFASGDTPEELWEAVDEAISLYRLPMTGGLYGTVGANVRRIRGERGLPADALARQMREAAGMDWGRGSVAALEAGIRHLTLEEFFAMACALDVTPADLLAGSGSVEVAGASRPLALLRSVLQGGILPHATRRSVDTPESAARNEAERAMAAAVHATPLDVVAAAFERWGHSLTEERERRVAAARTAGVSPRSLQAIRGHVTRDLRREIEGMLRA